MIKDHPKCVTCVHRTIGTETVVEERKTYFVSRCKADAVQFKRAEGSKVIRIEHPFGKDAKGPVLTCREMLLNGCRDFKLRQPITNTEPANAKQSPRIPHAIGSSRNLRSSKSDHRLGELDSRTPERSIG